MPVIPLDGGPGDADRVLAVMHFPDSEARQKQYCAVRCASTKLLDASHGDMFSVSREMLRFLIQAPAWEHLSVEANGRAKDGIVAGDLLSILYVMHQFELRPTINRAMWVMHKYAASGAAFGDKAKYPRGERKIRECWNAFSPVAHLWGAWGLNRADFYPYAPNGSVFSDRQNFAQFLGVAAELLRFATSFVAEGTPIPRGIQKAEPMLNVKDCFALSAGVKPCAFTSTQHPDRLRELLRGYKAPTSYRPT